MMNKVVAFLEKHVQWIALGLGFLYLGYMIYGYVVQTPVVVVGVAPTPLTPGEVDPYIRDSVAYPLDRAMKVTSVPEMTVPNFIDRFKADMSFSDFTPYAMTMNPDSQTVKIQLVPTPKQDIAPELPIAALPTLPPSKVLDFSTGRSNVQLNAPGAPGAPPPANGAQAVAGAADKSWVTVSYSIPATDLAKAFQLANIPAWTDHTSMLEIQLWREEEGPGGKWSDPKLITPINSQSLQPFPAGGNAAALTNFLTWAKAHVADILQPAFYVVNKGDPWHAPGQVLNVTLNQPTSLPPLEPSKTYPASVLSQYTPAQKLAYFHAKNNLNAGQPRGGNRPPQGGPPPGQFPRANPEPGSVGTEVFADALPSDVPPGPPAAGAGTTDLSAQFPIPAGDFDPAVLNADITGWAHDDTVEPGHTYRYMISYRIKNPIYGIQAAKINPALVPIFDIQSPAGIWSKPINVASTTNFFVFANSRPGALSARLKVYKWQNGVERSKVFEVAPGDIIGGKDGDVDFATGWTVVDLRFDDPKNPDSMTILVMDPNGTLERRDYNTDQKKPELKALDQQVSSAGAADQLAGGK
jgi:hypothetical protein